MFCGGDNATAFVWAALSDLNLSHNSISSLGDALVSFLCRLIDKLSTIYYLECTYVKSCSQKYAIFIIQKYLPAVQRVDLSDNQVACNHSGIQVMNACICIHTCVCVCIINTWIVHRNYIL